VKCGLAQYMDRIYSWLDDTTGRSHTGHSNLDQRFEILLVEDNPADVLLMRDALGRNFSKPYRLLVAADGDEAVRFLKQESGCFEFVPRPDLILLDLNLPKIDGYGVLDAIKSDPDLRLIPTIILSCSASDRDVMRAYQLHANSYLTKPVNLQDYPGFVKSIENFWFTFARLPTALSRGANP
jgi:two-component system, chemotaxis family, response regulator Rcp1